MILINILLGLAAAVLFVGVIGEQDKEKNRNITMAFVAVVLFIITANTIF